MTVRPFDIERELLHAVRQLPAARVAEVLDFAHFLASKDPAPANGGEQTPDEWDRQIEQISHEQHAYERQHSELLEKYEGRYIAMRHGLVIDEDADMVILSRRIRRQHGNEPILIKLVQTEPKATYFVRSPKLVRTKA